ncbi:hypothetical protein Glove_94g30 [Diversispora epigaea]|uniref:MARVEL domain-containing protein n=1 Tax=Diversispora epigaea TaxID=1348612 RepID=A0A397JEM0_9GLOM|nr:hypothetical protein Glove_94g30 [Diversispora epigaea]
MQKCCFCISLKPGVIIISVLSLYNAATVIFATIITLNNSQKIYNYPSNAVYTYSLAYTIVSLIVYSLLFVAFSFGLYVSIQERRVDLIEHYALILYAYVLISAAMYLGMIFIILNNKKEYCEVIRVKDCTNFILLSPVIGLIISILLNIYFAQIVSAYAKQTELLLNPNNPNNPNTTVQV